MQTMIEKTKWKFIFLTILDVIVIALFFVYRSSFDMWGKKYSEISAWLQFFDYFYFVIIIICFYCYVKFLFKKSEQLNQIFKKKNG
jgi:uncharacterized membrane protein